MAISLRALLAFTVFFGGLTISSSASAEDHDPLVWFVIMGGGLVINMFVALLVGLIFKYIAGWPRQIWQSFFIGLGIYVIANVLDRISNYLLVLNAHSSFWDYFTNMFVLSPYVLTPYALSPCDPLFFWPLLIVLSIVFAIRTIKWTRRWLRKKSD